MSSETNIDHDKVMALFGNVFNDVAGSIAIMMSYIGDQTGVYKAMDKLGSASVASIAKEANVDERYLKEWLASNAGRGYVNYNPDSDEFSLSPEQAAVFAREGRINVHSRTCSRCSGAVCKRRCSDRRI
jgi:hypothetical protein